MLVPVAAIALMLVLVCSSMVGALILGNETRAGGMENKWVISEGAGYMGLDFVAKDGSIIARESQPGSDLIAVKPDGTIEWRFETNAVPWATQGPNGDFYLIDWNTRPVYNDYSRIGLRNLTVLDPAGHFRWSYVVPNGTLDIWGIYPDGGVITHYHADEYNSTLGRTITTVDRIVAISDSGSELWSWDWPLNDTSPNYPRFADNGTFLVNAYTHTLPLQYYEIGVSKDGSHLFIEGGIDYYYDFYEPDSSRNGSVGYYVRQSFIDNDTSIIGVYAVSLPNCSQLWNTTLHLSDNPGQFQPGVAGIDSVVVGENGVIYSGDIVGKYSYALSPDGEILWQRPYLGDFVTAYPSGDVLAMGNDWISRINSNGSVVWKHYAHLDGNSYTLIGKDDTVYYSTKSSIVALVPASGLSPNVLGLLAIVAVDLASVTAFVLFRSMKRRSSGLH
jgi:hypothetical protein